MTAIFRGCSSALDDSLEEFLVKHDPEYAAAAAATTAATAATTAGFVSDAAVDDDMWEPYSLPVSLPKSQVLLQHQQHHSSVAADRRELCCRRSLSNGNFVAQNQPQNERPREQLVEGSEKQQHEQWLMNQRQTACFSTAISAVPCFSSVPAPAAEEAPPQPPPLLAYNRESSSSGSNRMQQQQQEKLQQQPGSTQTISSYSRPPQNRSKATSSGELRQAKEHFTDSYARHSVAGAASAHTTAAFPEQQRSPRRAAGPAEPTAETTAAVKLDTQKLGRAFSVAVMGIGEHVKQGGELLWRSAVSAAAQVAEQEHQRSNSSSSSIGAVGKRQQPEGWLRERSRGDTTTTGDRPSSSISASGGIPAALRISPASLFSASLASAVAYTTTSCWNVAQQQQAAVRYAAAAGGFRSLLWRSTNSANPDFGPYHDSSTASTTSAASASGPPAAAAAAQGTAPPFAPVWGDGGFELLLREQEKRGQPTGKLVVTASMPSSAIINSNSPATDERSRSAENDLFLNRCTYTWRRRLPSGCAVELPAMKNKQTYRLCSDDIGCFVEVTCTAPSSNGLRNIATAETSQKERKPVKEMHASLGPFQVDARSRCCVLNSFAASSARFPCRLVFGEESETSDDDESSTEEDDFSCFYRSSVDSPRSGKTTSTLSQREGVEERERREVFVYVNNEEVGVVRRSANEASQCAWRGAFAADFPSVQLDPTHSRSFTLLLDENTRIKLSAYTRYERDVLAMTLRCFHARALIGAAALLDLIHSAAGSSTTRGGHKGGAAADEIVLELEDKRIDLYVLLDLLHSEMQQATANGARISRECSRLRREKTALEEEITSTIDAFQQQLTHAEPPQREGLEDESKFSRNDSANSGNSKRAEQLIEENMRTGHAHNYHAITHEVDQRRFRRLHRHRDEKEIYAEELHRRLDVLAAEKQQLQQRNEQLLKQLQLQQQQAEKCLGEGSYELNHRSSGQKCMGDVKLAERGMDSVLVQQLRSEIERLREAVDAAHLDKLRAHSEVAEKIEQQKTEKEAAAAASKCAAQQIDSLKDSNFNLTQTTQNFRVALQQAEERVEALQQELQEKMNLQAQFQEKQLQLQQELQLEQKQQIEQKLQFQRQLQQQEEMHQQSIASLQAERNRQRSLIDSLTRDCEKSRITVESGVTKQKKLQEEKEQLEQQLKVQLQQQQESVAALHQERQNHQHQLQQKQQQLQALQERLQQQEQQLQNLRREIDALRSQAKEALKKSAAETGGSGGGNSNGTEEQLRVHLESLTAKLAVKVEENQKLKDERDNLKTRLRKLSSKASAAGEAQL